MDTNDTAAAAEQTRRGPQSTLKALVTPRLVEAAEEFAAECLREAERIVARGEDAPYDGHIVTASTLISDAFSWEPDEDGEHSNCWPLSENRDSRPFGCRFYREGDALVADIPEEAA